MPSAPTKIERVEGVVVDLRTPPIARVVPEGVFDAFGWCDSDLLEWRRPAQAWRQDLAISSDNPPNMAFVLRHACDFLPLELARLHVRGLGLDEEWALAPYGIDDATDELHARAVRPRDLLWLAAEHLPQLAWGLHDWAHFHNHGPFVERAWTELQCDATALAWLWINRGAIGLEVDAWERARGAFVGVSRQRFDAEGKGFDAGVLDRERIEELATAGLARAPISAERAPG
jgi:hypothetical protein